MDATVLLPRFSLQIIPRTLTGKNEQLIVYFTLFFFNGTLLENIIHAYKTRLKITEFEKVRFIKVNELK